jgi:hypothetical protein
VADRSTACAAIARDLGEPLPGTAPEATGWLLIEDRGPWGRDGLDNGTLPLTVIQHLQAALADRPIRYQAIRRTSQRAGPERNVFLAHSGATPWARRLTMPVDDLISLDPAATLSPVPPEIGQPHADPIALVCTHAKRDACCAERGIHVARAVAGLEPEATWETSHTGGHRFAPNVLVLPAGAVYGFMDEVRALEAITAARSGQVVLHGYRGRSSHPRFVQAAEVWVRERFDLTGLRDVLVEETVIEGDVALVRLRLPSEVVTIRVARSDLSPRPVSCGAEPTVPDSWQVVDRVR